MIPPKNARVMILPKNKDLMFCILRGYTVILFSSELPKRH